MVGEIISARRAELSRNGGRHHLGMMGGFVRNQHPKSVVERELIRRLASLLWRLRRANLIEAGLLSIYSEMTPDRDKEPDVAPRPEVPVTAALIRRLSLKANYSDSDNRHQNRAMTGDDGDFETSANSHNDKRGPLRRAFCGLQIWAASRWSASVATRRVYGDNSCKCFSRLTRPSITALPLHVVALNRIRRNGDTRLNKLDRLPSDEVS